MLTCLLSFHKRNVFAYMFMNNIWLDLTWYINNIGLSRRSFVIKHE
jgi:hypothetical protein